MAVKWLGDKLFHEGKTITARLSKHVIFLVCSAIPRPNSKAEASLDSQTPCKAAGDDPFHG